MYTAEAAENEIQRCVRVGLGMCVYTDYLYVFVYIQYLTHRRTAKGRLRTTHRCPEGGHVGAEALQPET